MCTLDIDQSQMSFLFQDLLQLWSPILCDMFLLASEST